MTKSTVLEHSGKLLFPFADQNIEMDASVVMELVGHEHLNTTDRYYNKISFEVMRQELKKYSDPCGKKKKSKSRGKITMANAMAKILKSII